LFHILDASQLLSNAENHNPAIQSKNPIQNPPYFHTSEELQYSVECSSF
jgi:hypothetical protein